MQAVAAVVRQRLQDAAAAAAGGKAQAEAAAASRQQAQRDAEQRKQRKLEQVTAQVTAAAAAHAREVSALQAQLAALQRQNKQLLGRCGQQGREVSLLRQAAEAAEAGGAREQVLQEQLQAVKRGATAEVSALRQREAASRKAERQQAQAAAEAAASQHKLQLRSLRRAHTAELRGQCEAQQQAQQGQLQRMQAALGAGFRELGGELEGLREHAAGQALLSFDDAAACLRATASECGLWMAKQVQQMRAELTGVRAEATELACVAGGQQQELQRLHQQLAQHAPDGLAALAAAVAAAKAEHVAVLKQRDAACEQLKQQAAALQELQQARAKLSDALGAAEAQLAEARAAEHAGVRAAQQLATQQADTQQQLQAALASLEAHHHAAAAQGEQAAGEHEQLEQQHQASMSELHQQLRRAHEEAQAAQQRVAWLHDTYLSLADTVPPPSSGHKGDAGGADAPLSCTSSTPGAQELMTMCSRLFGAGGLERLMQAFQQHKDEQAAASDDAAAPLQQLLLQLEAGLLQVMLRVHEAAACVHHAQPAASPRAAAVARLERNGSADSSACSTDVLSCRSLGLPSCGGSSSGGSASGAAGAGMSSQLLLALQRDRAALAAQVKQLRGARTMPAAPEAAATQSPWRSAAAAELDELVSLLKGGFQEQPPAAPASPAAVPVARLQVPPAGPGRRPAAQPAASKAKPATRALSWGARHQRPASQQQPDVDAVLRKCESVLASK